MHESFETAKPPTAVFSSGPSFWQISKKPSSLLTFSLVAPPPVVPSISLSCFVYLYLPFSFSHLVRDVEWADLYPVPRECLSLSAFQLFVSTFPRRFGSALDSPLVVRGLLRRFFPSTMADLYAGRRNAAVATASPRKYLGKLWSIDAWGMFDGLRLNGLWDVVEGWGIFIARYAYVCMVGEIVVTWKILGSWPIVNAGILRQAFFDASCTRVSFGEFLLGGSPER